MKIVITTPEGELYNEEVDSIVVSSKNNGDYGLLNHHIPITSIIDTGYLKLTRETLVYYVIIINGILENHHNNVSVIAQDAFIGLDKEEAFNNLMEIRKNRIEENKNRNIELAMAERELKKQIRQSGAGSV